MLKFLNKNKKINNKGSVLLSVLLITTILTLFIMTMQPIIGGYIQRSVKENNIKQAELSSKSANDMIIKTIVSKNPELIDRMNNLPNGGILKIDSFNFKSSKMGTVDGEIKRISSEEFSVETEAIVKDSKRIITRSIVKNSITSGVEPLSSFYFYNASFINDRGFNVSGNTPVVVENGFDISGGNIDVGGDLILFPSSLNMTRVRSNGIVDIQGNLYTGSGEFRIQNSGVITINGNSYDRTNTNITRSVSINNTKYCADIYQVTNEIISQHSGTPSWVNGPEPQYTGGNLNGGSRYVMNQINPINLDILLNPSVTPENPAYVIIPNNSHLRISSVLNGDSSRNPRVVFILQGNAQLTLQHQSSAIVHGTVDTVLNINRPGGGVSNFYGQIKIGSIVNNSNNQIILDYRSVGFSGSTNTEEWIPGLYSKPTQ